jgi:hypothetical protein
VVMAAVITLYLARRGVVIALEAVCGFLDGLRWLPWPVTRLRCPHGLADLSEALDERWKTGVWRR